MPWFASRRSGKPVWRSLLSGIFLLLACAASAFDTIEFLKPIPLERVDGPAALALGEDRIYVTDGKDHKLFIFDGQGAFLRDVGSKGDGRKEFRDPVGLTVGPDGRVFVADKGNGRIQVLSRDGEFLASFGSKGSEAGSLSGPEGVSVGTDGRVYVADTGRKRIKVFTGGGIFLYGFGESGDQPGQLGDPTKVVVDPSDNIYVLDRGSDRVQKFDPATLFVTHFAVQGEDMALDAYGFVYVLEPDDSKVHEFSPEAARLGRFGSSGKGKTQFKDPEGIAVSPDGSVVYVLDSGNKRVQRIKLANNLKTKKLTSNPAAKLLVTGPSASWKRKVDTIEALEEDVYAYDGEAGQFVVLGPNGEAKRLFGTKKGKGGEVTKGTRGFAVSKTLGIYVSDTPKNRIQRFDLEGKWQGNFAEQDGFFDSRKKEGRVSSPRGIAVNEKGTFYVADPGNRRVDVLSPDGAFLSAIGPEVGAYKLEEPHDVAWDDEGFIYIIDKGLKRLFKCGPSGNLLASWGGEGNGVGQFQSPEAVAYDGTNYVYVLDEGLRRVSVFTKDGRWMTDLLSGGEGEQELEKPVGLAVQGAKLLVADKGKGRILTFDMHPYLVAPVAVSTAIEGGTVAVSWKPVADPWAKGYVVLRSTRLGGPWERIGFSEKTEYGDEEVEGDLTYYYRLATESRTGDLGEPSPAVEVRVPAAFNRSPVEISTITIGNIFSASYKWYLKNPVGKVVVTNNMNVAFENVKLTFRLKDFMDFGYDTVIEKLGPRGTTELPLIATLNNKILEVSEDTPVQAEFELTYFLKGKQQKFSLTKPLRVYSRNAITWDEPRRIATFITPKDPPVLGFSRETVRTAPSVPAAAHLNRSLVTAAHLWDALSEYGIKFITNPNNPYAAISEDPSFPVDNTQFPRETLKLKSGQCDDIVTLMASVLGAAQVRTALLDYPGHLALMFDLETDDPVEAGLPEDDMILHAGSYWLPVEATMIGRPFSEAVGKARYAYKTENQKGAVTVIDVEEAWKTFEPATLPKADWSAEVPAVEARAARFSKEAEGWAKDRYRFLKKHYEELLKKRKNDLDVLNDFGILEHQAGHAKKAKKLFEEVLSADPSNAAAWNNMATMDYLAGNHAMAEARYLTATESDAEDAGVWLNLVRCALKLKEPKKAKQYAERAVALDPGLGPVVQAWLKSTR